MHLRFIFIGKTKEQAIKELEEKYLKLVSKYCKFEIDFIKEETNGETDKIKNLEGKKVLEKVGTGDYLVLLDDKGAQFTSEAFADKFQSWQNNSTKPIFVIAGAFGASLELKQRANLNLSFSKMTFTHEMIRVMLFEQIFRAFSILKGTGYHK